MARQTDRQTDRQKQEALANQSVIASDPGNYYQSQTVQSLQPVRVNRSITAVGELLANMSTAGVKRDAPLHSAPPAP